MSRSHAILKNFRLLHLYMGIFIAPSLLFFAITGALQSFSLHESHSANYTPPSWLVHLSQMHKNQTLEVPVRKPGPPPAAPKPAPKPADSSAPPAKDIHAPSPMKFFFLFVSLGLCLSTCTGLYMAYKFNRNSTAVTGTLIAGIVVPVSLAIFFP
jgi:hypothetical protein